MTPTVFFLGVAGAVLVAAATAFFLGLAALGVWWPDKRVLMARDMAACGLLLVVIALGLICLRAAVDAGLV